MKPDPRQLRQQIADTAARLMAEQGIESFALARRKAIERLGADPRAMPDNREVEQALRDYQRLFLGDEHQSDLERLRRAALQAMRALTDFQPRLVGPVLSGTANKHTPVSLHLFADAPEEIAVNLMERGIDYRVSEKRLRQRDKTTHHQPSYQFLADDIEFELVVFSFIQQRQAPPSAVNGKPMARASLAQVEALLKTNS